MVILIKKKTAVALISVFVSVMIGVSAFAAYNVTASEDTVPDGVPVPVLMYHGILDSDAKTGKYVVTPRQLEEDFKYLADNGYRTVVMADLIAYTEGRGDLPAKPVVITFDDGYYNNYSYLYPLLKQYRMKAVISVIGYYTEQYSKEGATLNNNYSHITWNELQEMQTSGLVEVQNHSYNMHKTDGRRGILRKRGESAGQYEKILTDDLQKTQDLVAKYLDRPCTTFTYPFGSVNKETAQIVRSMGFKATLSCQEGISVVTKDPESLFDLKRYNRSGKTTTEAFFKKVFDD